MWKNTQKKWKRVENTRWGRDYLQVGNAMEIFRRNNVRFIAVNNGIDSEKPDTLDVYKRQIRAEQLVNQRNHQLWAILQQRAESVIIRCIDCLHLLPF